MMKWLKQHPFPVEAWFDRVLALSFAVPESIARELISPKLGVDANEGSGFITVALVSTKDLRPLDQCTRRWPRRNGCRANGSSSITSTRYA